MTIYTTEIIGVKQITADMCVMQWSVVGVDSNTIFTIYGSGRVKGANPTPVVCTGSYNSAQAPTSSPWDGVTIEVTSGAASLVLTTDYST